MTRNRITRIGPDCRVPDRPCVEDCDGVPDDYEEREQDHYDRQREEQAARDDAREREKQQPNL